MLTTGLDNLEHCLLAIRNLFLVLRSELPDADQQPDPYGDELRAAFAVVLHDVGDCLRAFGSLVVAEAEDREEETEQALAESLDILRETNAILTELIMVDAQEKNTASWLLRGSILAAVEQVLAQLDLENRARTHQAWKERAGPPATGPAAVADRRGPAAPGTALSRADSAAVASCVDSRWTWPCGRTPR